MIVRDEERWLGDCLKSIAGELDEIVVVDTGSADNTPEIARQYGAEVIERAWADDFSDARNCALDHASCDWILYIDADERLSVPEPGALRRAIDRDDAAACWVMFQPRVKFTCYHELRLFRRDPRIRFRGAIHETVHPAVDAVCRSDGLKIVAADVRLDHLGYEGDLARKYHRNLPILQRAVAEYPQRVFLWADMAQALAGLDRREDAEQACWRAIDLAAASTDAKQHNDGAIAWQCLIGIYLASDPARAAELSDRAVEAYPQHHALALARANAHFAAGGGAEIIPALERLTQIDAGTFVDPLTAYDHRIFGEWPFDLMGGVYARLGQRKLAAEAFRRAAQLAPANPGYRAKAIALSGGKTDPSGMR
jgi:tetratricopeptide (TPR) repeat protein